MGDIEERLSSSASVCSIGSVFRLKCQVCGRCHYPKIAWNIIVQSTQPVNLNRRQHERTKLLGKRRGFVFD